MKDLLKIAAVLALVFASTFLLIQSTGLVTAAGVTSLLEDARQLSPFWLVALILILLILDLFIAVPTMTTILLAGFFLGPWLGGAASALGLMLMGSGGYVIGRRFGRKALLRLYRDEKRLDDIERAFARNDMLTLFVCQALPILPELSCTLAGISRMHVPRFLFGYTVGVAPFAFVVAYAGSISTVADPSPAIYTAITVTAVLLMLWSLLRRRARTSVR